MFDFCFDSHLTVLSKQKQTPLLPTIRKYIFLFMNRDACYIALRKQAIKSVSSLDIFPVYPVHGGIDRVGNIGDYRLIT